MAETADQGQVGGGNPIADAVQNSWVDTAAPASAKPYLRLARLDRPIGTWLLLWPCLWSLTLAASTTPVSTATYLWLSLLFVLGATVMRGAGCTYNDIVDRNYDAQVERTSNRPVASGVISVRNAWLFLAAQCFVGLVVLLQLNTFSIALGAGSLVLVAIYPFMKRVTYWPQAWLGLTFNWGALLGWSAITGTLSVAPFLLYAAGIAWTLGYDTIYAHQDKEDDALIGVKSTALKLGEATKVWLWLFYGTASLLFVAAGLAAGIGWPFFVGWIAASAHLAWQISSVNIHNPSSCLGVFRANREFGIILFLAFLLGTI